MEPSTTYYNSVRAKLGGIVPVFKILVAAVCLVAVLAKVAASTQFIFNDGRLAPVFSMLHGNPPYYPLDRGPLLNTVYGPLSYVYYFPCGFFSHNITLAIIAGSLLSFAAFALPSGLVLYRRREYLDGSQALWLMILCVLQIFFYAGPAFSAFNIHADAPAILLSSLCILSLDRREGSITSRRALLLSATFGVLTVWTKQTYAAVILVPLAVALVEKQGWKLRLALVGWIALLNSLLLLIFCLWCGFDALLENFLVIPGAIPSIQVSFLYGSDTQATGALGHLRSFVVSAHILIGKYLTPYLLCFFLYLLSRLKNGWAAPAGNLSVQVPRLAGLFFLLALLNVPLAADSAIKMAGPAVNDDNPFAWFFIFAIFCLIVEKKKSGASPENHWRADRAIYALFVVISLVSFVGAVRHLPANFKAIRNVFQNDEAVIAEISRQSPGKFYFPWNPAAVYVGEGKLYHWGYITELRCTVGKPPTLDHFNQYIPPKASIIGLPANDTGVLSDYVQNLKPCTNSPVARLDHFVWFTFDHKP